ncbi:MAG TPA: thioredoxin-dependent thiol peroxidase [Cytophagaceae bacterium]|nr:thioredoxin-dependent thiol peroxidase [Cytophagaceae bacterium]
MKLNIGDKAPVFQGKDQDGNEVNLENFLGKKVVLYFYPGDFTEGCTVQSCNLRDNYHRLMSQGYEVIGISTDDEESHHKFREKYNLPFSLIADTDKSINELYGVWVEKNMYGNTYMGTARTTFIIDETGIITDIITKIDKENHADQILHTDSKAEDVPYEEVKEEKSTGSSEEKTTAPAAKKSPKKSPAKKASAKKAVTKTTVKKAAAKKPATKKAAPKKTTAKKAAPKAAAKKSPAKKAAAKKPAVKKAAPKKATAKKTAKKPIAKKAAPKKVVKKTSVKPMAKMAKPKKEKKDKKKKDKKKKK